MTVFFTALFTVALLLLVAAVGYIFKRRNMVSEDCIPGFSKVLLFTCQPCLAVYSFSTVELSRESLVRMGIFALFVLAVFILVMGGAYLVLRKKCAEPIYRILTIGTTFSNCAFFGIPIIEALIPEAAAGVIIYTTVFALVMNVLGWTVGSAIITGDLKYVSLKNIILNPSTLGTAAAFIIFLTGISLPVELSGLIETVARMSTPLSMLIIGMRLATVEFKKIFTDYRLYLTVAVKQLLMPAVAFLMVIFLKELDVNMRRALFIICACPAASVVLNFAELVGEGQREAANLVLLSTILSIVTLPLMMLLLPIIV